MKNAYCTLGLLLLLGQSFAESNNNLQKITYRSFWQPVYLGARLNYCDSTNQICGSKLADKYCKLMGYDKVLNNEIAYNLGYTHALPHKTHCNNLSCNGFKYINCMRSLVKSRPASYYYRQKLFVSPRWQHHRIDWCYTQRSGCGLKAANSFCKRVGFMKAKSFIKEQPLSCTKHIGSDQLCLGSTCSGFKTIVCYR